jgi:hypothetical protein
MKSDHALEHCNTEISKNKKQKKTPTVHQQGNKLQDKNMIKYFEAIRKKE